jgi:hypothetical protein
MPSNAFVFQCMAWEKAARIPGEQDADGKMIILDQFGRVGIDKSLEWLVQADVQPSTEK